MNEQQGGLSKHQRKNESALPLIRTGKHSFDIATLRHPHDHDEPTFASEHNPRLGKALTDQPNDEDRI